MKRPPPTASIGDKKRWHEDAGGRPSGAQLDAVREVVHEKFPLRDDVDPDHVIEKVSWFFGNYYRVLGAGVDGFRDKQKRETAALELESLFEITSDSTQFTQRSHELGPLARWALYDAQYDDGSGGVVSVGTAGDHRFDRKLGLPMGASEGRAVPRFEEVDGRLKQVGVIQTSNDAREFALETARRLRGSLGAGRPPEAAELALAKSLAKIWLEVASRGLRSETHLSLSEQKRSGSAGARRWHYREFVEAIVSVETPGYNAEGVCQRVVQMKEFQVTGSPKK